MTDVLTGTVADTARLAERVLAEVEQVIVGKRATVTMVLLGVLASGHILIEDLPGLGKTTIALALAGITNLSFGRVQCTSDLLPSDVLGVSVFNPQTSAFEFHPGPIFSNIVLADEINRTTPKTQSALLEANLSLTE